MDTQWLNQRRHDRINRLLTDDTGPHQTLTPTISPTEALTGARAGRQKSGSRCRTAPTGLSSS